MTQSYSHGPDQRGLFGPFGGQFVAETLMPLINDLAAEYEAAKKDPAFLEELAYFQRDYIGRPSPLYYAERLSEHFGGAKIYLKREDLNHTGAHKINNAIGQVMLARRMGKKRVIAETGAGMHGVATATVAARFGMECIVYMGATGWPPLNSTQNGMLRTPNAWLSWPAISGCSSLLSFISMIFSTPLLPSTAGRPTKRPLMPYSPRLDSFIECLLL